MKKLALSFGSIALAQIGLPGLVSAQTTSGQGEAGATIAEVVVTANKREERLQDVPVAVSAVSGDDLASFNIVETREITRLVPSVILSGTDVASFSQGFQVRGVGTQVNSATLPQSVSVVLDGIALANTAMGRMDFSDVERIEVLRGPQGMLFGRNASAGVINIVTRQPQLSETELATHLSYGKASDFDDRLAQMTGNIPLGSAAALRVNAYYHNRGGFMTNAVNGEELNEYQDQGIRAKFRWEPSEFFSLNFSADYSEQEDPYRNNSILEVVPGTPRAAELATYGVVAGLRNNKVVNNAPTDGSSYAGGATLRLDWRLGEHTLTSTTGYRNYTIEDFTKDNDNSIAGTFDIATIDGPMDQYTQELQLTSPTGGRVEYVAGLFYDHFESDSSSRFGGSLPPTLCTPLPISPCVSEWFFLYRTNSAAAYGQATIRFNDRLRGIVGGRYTHDWIDFRYRNGIAPGYSSAAAFFPQVSAFYQEDTHDNISWRTGLQFDFADEVMGYATISTGYKAPGFDSTGVREGADQLVFAETALNYEIGLKSSWLNGRLVANADVFYTTFEDFQTQVTVQVPGGLNAFRTQNAGELRTKGFGIDVIAAPVDGLRFGVNVAYTDGYFTDYANAACYRGQTAALGCNPTTPPTTVADGNALPNAPEWVYSTSASYNRPLTDNLRGFISADWYHRSAASLSAADDPLLVLPAYGLLGAAIGLEADDGRWRFSVTGKNILDKAFPISLSRGGGVTNPDVVLSHYFTQEAYRTIYANIDFRF